MCYGPLKRLCYWGPITALGIIKIISFMMVHCSNMVLPYTGSLLGFTNMLLFLCCCALSIYNLLSAMFEGPGYLPRRWCPEYAADEAYLQYCHICEGFKAPRAHHCRKCDRCVLKMDHHCPWINNCVGHANHAHFTACLFFSVIGSFQSSIVMSFTLYKAFYRSWFLYNGYETNVRFSVATLILTVFAVGLAIGVVISVGMLLFFQIRAILRNRTIIEDWILEKAVLRRAPSDPPFVFPYYLGWKKNFIQVLNLNLEPLGDGISWPVVAGCTQYTLTLEQKDQKAEKRARTRLYKAIRSFSGHWFPVVHGFGVFLHPPCTDESRIALQPGELLSVTRWRKYWLFGKKNTGEGGGDERTVRGWFPRCCVVDAGDEADFEEVANRTDLLVKKRL